MIAKDPDDLYGEDVVFEIQIKGRRNGTMSVAGSINHKEHALAVLEAAKDSIRSYHDRQKLENGGLIIPSSDSPLRC